MNIVEIDKNLQSLAVRESDVVWRNALEQPFSLHGVFYSEEEKLYRRMPKEIADQVNDGVKGLSVCTTGGRLRFITDSPYVAVKASMPPVAISSNSSLGSKCGFSVYSDGVFEGNLRPEYDATQNLVNGRFSFASLAYAREKKERFIELCFPRYSGVFEAYIGLKEGSSLKPATAQYAYPLPIVFYGSSITQGGSTSRSGNDYISHVTRWLNADYVNLGFGGSARGERIMAEYLASLKAAAIVLDYDHNAPDVEWLENTHAEMYRIIRAAQPKTPILLMSKPDFHYAPEKNALRREVIYKTYLRAKAQGDAVFFADGAEMFGKDEWDICTVDNIHPNDLGFYRMAKYVYPILREMLEGAKQ